MKLVSKEDMDYYISSSNNINKILTGMTALMNDIDNKVEILENQSWFQRMVKTVFGKNKATKEEIKKNHDKLNLYVIEVIKELYTRDLINQDIIINLGNNLNKLYSEHILLSKELENFKKFVGATFIKLNEKIESIDNFYMLNKEIEQDRFKKTKPIIAICEVISELDNRTILDERKLNILSNSLKLKNIINDDGILLSELLEEILKAPDKVMEKIYLDSSYCNKNSPQKIFYQVIENYYFLSDFEKIVKDKKILINKILSDNMVKDTKLTTSIVYEYLVKNKASKIMEIKKCLEDVKNISKETIWETEEDLLKKAKNLYIEKKLGEAYEIFYSLSIKNNIESLFYLGAIEEQRKNYEQAFEWFLRSANKGNSNSQVLLGRYYEDGLGVEKNLFKAFEWYKKSAEQNNATGQLFLASCYLGGIGTKVDLAIATEWLKKSANQGNTMAKERLDNIIKEVTVLNKKYFNN